MTIICWDTVILTSNHYSVGNILVVFNSKILAELHTEINSLL